MKIMSAANSYKMFCAVLAALAVLIVKTIAHLSFLLSALVFVVVIGIGFYHVAIFAISKLFLFLLQYILPALALGLAALTVLAANPIHSLLCLIGAFFNIVIFYLSVNAEFLALVFLIVYVGAVAILFLFVIMLLNVKELAGVSKNFIGTRRKFTIIVTGPLVVNFTFLIAEAFERIFTLGAAGQPATELRSAKHFSLYVTEQFSDISFFSNVLYSCYAYLFILISCLLFSSMVGAIVLATNTVDSYARKK